MLETDNFGWKDSEWTLPLIRAVQMVFILALHIGGERGKVKN